MGYNSGVGNLEARVVDSYVNSSTSGFSFTLGRSGVNSVEINVSTRTTSELQMPTAYDENVDAADGSSLYERWNVDLDNADGDNDLSTGGDDPWDFGASNRYPKLKAEWDEMSGATAVEFGLAQRFILTDLSDVEVHSFSVQAGHPAGRVGFIKDVDGDC